MSAYMVNEDTLDLIASVAVWSNHGLFVYAGEGTLPPRGELEYAGEGQSVYYRASHLKDIKQELRLENIASLNARYPQDAGLAGEGAPLRAVYRDQATYGEALGALACYEYQACESDTWRNSYAHLLCVAIRKAICNLISEGEWEYERPAGQAQRISLIDLISKGGE
jgi:hypothetical protein